MPVITEELNANANEQRAKWYPRAKCNIDPYASTREFVEYFFPVDQDGNVDALAEEEHATEYCSDCPVRAHCINWAISTDHLWDGVFGTSSMKRRSLLRKILKTNPKSAWKDNAAALIDEAVTEFLSNDCVIPRKKRVSSANAKAAQAG